jgi:hypothetical protein
MEAAMERVEEEQIQAETITENQYWSWGIRLLSILINVLEVLYGFRRSESDIRNDLVEFSGC